MQGESRGPTTQDGRGKNACNLSTKDIWFCQKHVNNDKGHKGIKKDRKKKKKKSRALYFKSEG